MENLKNECHVLIAIFPGQGHINPSLQFSKKLINLGVKVTLSCSLTAFNRIKNLPKIEGLTFAPFSDGYDGNFKGSFDEYHLLNSAIKIHGSEFIANLIKSKAKNGCPFTRVIYTIIMDWAGLVAKKFNIPSTLFWIQPATVFDIYYYRFTNFANYFKNCDSQDQIIELPGLPSLSSSDFPSFVFDDVKSNDWAVESIKRQIEILNSEENPRILVNTFDALELNALRVLKNVTMVGIGPSIPSSFLDEKDRKDNFFVADMIESENNYMEWLDARANKSVIYIAFGSYAEISNQWMEEIGQGLLKCGRPFLWVIRETLNGEKPEENLTCKDELEKIGRIVRWCSQMEVLKHPSVGCFLTHCGWNSTLESLASGVPIVACPIWNDQVCNAKLIQDVWKIGVRVNANREGIVKRDEFERCIEIVMGGSEEGEELRKNVKKWKDLAKEAMKENGSSNVNLKAYVNEFLLGHC
ncbi:PREDICTED: crocetin glucosyltransferase, chloroplastic-like isoform X1 [Nicotiana attenuata]|uniref:Glycosyltransferase n=1 Tax=Nicotiana attenuata TaxID=49451 RepID=A0A2I2MNK6_NICAT|nr:PREDICTED: crocetin glucosyltransferase, chloroplastic-like isoform X1 [Nicotiana attenuata]AQQ16722.1 UDP-glycosyltransferase g39264 [Nicotiana attenuata]OIT37258.1 udp-glycosyltransferase 75b1 [Nicotiana attenuata]